MIETIDTSSLKMAWSRLPWDESVCHFPVLQITSLKVLWSHATTDFRMFEQARDKLGSGLVSCRIPHNSLVESMLLEDHGFRFIEMLYTPELELSATEEVQNGNLLTVNRAIEMDMPALLDIAGTSFYHERFKMDPRLDPRISDQRFQNWVASSLHHPSQELYVVRDGERRISFFIIELLKDGTCYWHLNAVAPDAQGQGYGRRVWTSMLHHAFKSGAKRVRTSIAARNHRVLNLYARLGFTFQTPSMTFHWVRA